MTAQHTPGPWECWNDEGDIFVGDPVLSTVARVWKDADARLIAAAPLMLEALRGALADHSCDWNGCWHDQALEAIRAARGGDA